MGGSAQCKEGAFAHCHSHSASLRRLTERQLYEGSLRQARLSVRSTQYKSISTLGHGNTTMNHQHITGMAWVTTALQIQQDHTTGSVEACAWRLHALKAVMSKDTAVAVVRVFLAQGVQLLQLHMSTELHWVLWSTMNLN